MTTEDEFKSGCNSMGTGCNMFAVTFQGMVSMITSRVGCVIIIVVIGILILMSIM